MNHLVPVIFWNGARGFWDHALILDAIEGRLWPTPQPLQYEQLLSQEMCRDRGAVVVIPARHYASASKQMGEYARSLPWCVFLCTGDEEAVFPWRDVQGDRVKIWCQCPMPGVHDPKLIRPFVTGYRPETRPLLEKLWGGQCPPADRKLLWAYAGQNQNPARQACLEALKTRPSGEGWFRVSNGFGQGMHYDEYLGMMAEAYLAPCPSGTFTPDCFRHFEALESGCLPVSDYESPRKAGPYWQEFYGGVPFDFPGDWREFFDPKHNQYLTNQATAWWLRYKRQFVCDLEDDIRAVSGGTPHAATSHARSTVTVLLPTSPVSSHPSTAVIEDTVRHIRSYPELRECEIIVMVDGINPKQHHYREQYEEFKRRLIWLCNWHPDWRGVLPLVFDTWTHQATMTREALKLVRTPLIFFCEHDCWPTGDIPWNKLIGMMLERNLNYVRLHLFEQFLPEHEYLMVGDCADGLRRTVQWSQRPHLARKDFYERILTDHFHPSARTMIEDPLYGIISNAPWESYGLWIYAPEGNKLRSGHADARRGDPKYDMLYVRPDGSQKILEGSPAKL